MPSKPGDTYWHKEPLSPKPHLYVVLSDKQPCGRHIVVNITKFKTSKNYKPPQHVDIAKNTPFLDSGWPAEYRSTIYNRILLVHEEAIEVLKALPRANPDTILDHWLPKLRNAACKVSCDGDEQTAMGRYCGHW
jgi:hypothetical protein